MRMNLSDLLSKGLVEKFQSSKEQVGRIQIDKTSSIEMLIESIEKLVPHPLFKLDNTKARAKLMIELIRKQL